jgi:hypothetical protein
VTDAYGPVDFLILEYPSRADWTATANVLHDLVDRGVVALYDLMVVHREPDGTDTRDRPRQWLRRRPRRRSWRSPERAPACSGADDVAEAADVLEPGTNAVVIVYENRWAVAVRFGRAFGRRRGGRQRTTDRARDRGPPSTNSRPRAERSIPMPRIVARCRTHRRRRRHRHGGQRSCAASSGRTVR